MRDAMLWKSIHREQTRLSQGSDGKRSWNQQQVDAAVAAFSNTGNGQRVVQLSVLIDLQTLLNGLHAKSICSLPDGTTLPVSVVRQLACEAEIIPIVLDGDGVVLDQGRAKRLATPEQRLSLQAMYTTCAIPGCDVPVDECDAHHVDYYSRGGPTNLGNELPVCEKNGHHQQIHSGNWQITLDPDTRHATITRPDGSIFYQGPTITRAPTGLAA
jgi:hypothetical protein